MSTLITTLSMTGYYSLQPVVYRVDDVTVAFFDGVLYPRDHLA